MQTILAQFTFNSGSQTTRSFDTLEEAILAYRQARKAHRKAARACSFRYSMNGGSLWLK